MNKLSPLGNNRPQLRPITKSKDVEPEADVDDVSSQPSQSPLTPEPPPMAERIGEPDAAGGLLVPQDPVLEKPAPVTRLKPVPGEPKSEALLKTASNPKPAPKTEPQSLEPSSTPAPMSLFGEGESKPAETKAKPPVTPASTPAQKPVPIKQPPSEKEPTPVEPQPTPVKSASTGD